MDDVVERQPGNGIGPLVMELGLLLILETIITADVSRLNSSPY
jgi:hypothetical protein